MKKPNQYELKKWLCEGFIKGLNIEYRISGADTADTYWILTNSKEETKEVKHGCESFVDVDPDYSSVMCVTTAVRAEVEEWKKYAKKEARDLREYERLKKKFNAQ